MSTVIRPEVSKNCEHYISKHRYYELKHFVMQYPEWKKALTEINFYSRIVFSEVKTPKENPVEKLIFSRGRFLDNVSMVETAANEAGGEIARYILDGVIYGKSYDTLGCTLCSKAEYYKAYRRFFSILDKLKNA